MSVRPEVIGDRVERAGVDRYPIDLVDDDPDDVFGSHWYDATVVEPITSDLGGEIAADGDHVEIKGCCAKQENSRSGRWFIRKRNHDQLVDVDGHYVLIVYSPSGGSDSIDDPDDVEIKRIAIVDARTVDAAIDAHATWINSDGRDIHAKLPWSRIFGGLDHPGDDDISGLGRVEA